MQVHFCKPEPVGCRDHRLNTLARDIVETAGRHQNAKRLMRAAPDAAPELMELSQSETLRVLNEHDCRVCDVHADFNTNCI